MIGSRPPARRLKQPDPGSGSHGEPVEPNQRKVRQVVAPARAPRRGASGSGQSRRDAQAGHAMALRPAPRAGRRRDSRGRRRRTACWLPGAACRTLPTAPSSSPCRSSSTACRSLAGRSRGQVLGGLDREAAVGVYGALGPAGGARGVDDHHRVFGRRMFGVGLVIRLRAIARATSGRGRASMGSTAAPMRRRRSRAVQRGTGQAASSAIGFRSAMPGRGGRRRRP